MWRICEPIICWSEGILLRRNFQDMKEMISKYLLGSLRTMALGGIAFYLGYHLIQGENGAISYFLVSKELEHTNRVLALKTEKRKQLEHRVSLLRGDTLDLDMLAERSRIILNYGREDELVIFYE